MLWHPIPDPVLWENVRRLHSDKFRAANIRSGRQTRNTAGATSYLHVQGSIRKYVFAREKVGLTTRNVDWLSKGPLTWALKVYVENDRSVTTSWFKIWQEFNALASICGRRGLSGLSVVDGALILEFVAVSQVLKGTNPALSSPDRSTH